MNLQRLLRPSSIAAIGGLWAEQVVEQCRRLGYGGKVWGVNPHRKTLGGAPCFAAVHQLPSAPDAAFVGVNRHAAIETVRELSAMGCGGAVCFASGFAEVDAEDLQQALVQAAGDMPLLGPNCYGVINFLDGALLWPDQHGGRREKSGVAIIGQSSNVLISLTSQRRGLPLAYIAAAGNQAQTTMADIGRGMLADERVRAIGFYIEGITDADDFAAFAEEAAERGVRLAALKTGACELSAAAAQSHTATMAGTAAASAAFLRECRVAQIQNLPVFLETLKLFYVHGKRGGRRLLSLSCSGGEAGHIADLAEDVGLQFSPPPPILAQRWSDLLGGLVRISNPLDYHTFIWHDKEKLYETYLAGLCGGYDWNFLIYDEPRDDRCNVEGWHMPLQQYVRAAEESKHETAAVVVSSLPENMPETQAQALMEVGIAPMGGLSEALAAVCAAAEISEHENTFAQPNWRPLPRINLPQAKQHSEYKSKNFLRQHGIAVPQGMAAKTPQQAAAAAKEMAQRGIIRFAVKSMGLAHKSEHGGVRLNVAAEDVLAVAQSMPQVGGFLVEEMTADIVAEVIIAVRRDAVYGALLVVGMGGVQAELLNDTATLILPTTRKRILAAFAGLRLYPLLCGYRGAAVADVKSAVAVAEKLAHLIESEKGIQEIEINPLLLLPQGAVAADVLLLVENIPH